MNKLKRKITGKHLLFYFIWTITFAAIPLLRNGLENINIRLIIIAFIISAIISIPALNLFFKLLNKMYYPADLDLLPDTVIAKSRASYKKGGILYLDGTLVLNEKEIIFIGGEFFSKNKQLFSIKLNQVVECISISDKKIILKDNAGFKKIFLVDNASRFSFELSERIA